MIAGGLFDDTMQSGYHAKQACDFGLKCISLLNDYNEKNGTEFEIKIGINSSGPVIGGVIGSEKPALELSGQAVGFAYKMMCECYSGRVHISRYTYELVFSGAYNIREYVNPETNEMSYYIIPQF